LEIRKRNAKRLRFAALFAFVFLPFLTFAQSSVQIFYDVDAFDGYRMLRRQTVEVENGVIREVRPASERPFKPDFIDGAGKTLLPGLIDAHCHIGYQEEGLEQVAALGVTTELDMWGEPTRLRTLRQEIASGQHPNAADIRTAGIGASAPGGHPSEMQGPPYPKLGPPDDPQTFVDARIAGGSDYLKVIYDHLLPGLTFNQLSGLVATAHRRNLRVVVHETVRTPTLAIVSSAGGEALEPFPEEFTKRTL